MNEVKRGSEGNFLKRGQGSKQVLQEMGETVDDGMKERMGLAKTDTSPEWECKFLH